MKTKFAWVMGFLVFCAQFPAVGAIPGSIIGAGLYVRTEPWGTRTDVLSPSTAFTVTGAKWARHPTRGFSAIWYSIEYSGNKTGWVHSGFVETAGSPPVAQPLPPDPPYSPPLGMTPLKTTVPDAEKALNEFEPTTPAGPAATPPPVPSDADLTARPVGFPGTGDPNEIVAWEWNFRKDAQGKARTITWYKNFADYSLEKKVYPEPPWELRNSNPVRRDGSRK